MRKNSGSLATSLLHCLPLRHCMRRSCFLTGVGGGRWAGGRGARRKRGMPQLSERDLLLSVDLSGKL